MTDPPYGLADHKPERIAQAVTAWTSGNREHVPDARGFMGATWDAFVPPPAVWDECLRVLKPGGHLLAFAGSRTADLMGLSVRMAGFEIRDTIMWVYGSGMPKGMNIGKAIDKAAGAEREVVGRSARHVSGKPEQRTAGLNGESAFAESVGMGMYVTAPATPEAARWEGWNTSLKPSQEPIIVARKPLAGTVAANVLAHGTGAMNVDACRVAPLTPEEVARSGRSTNGAVYGEFGSVDWKRDGKPHPGRWPANVLLSHSESCHEPGGCDPSCPVAELDAQSGNARSSGVYKGDGSRRDSSATVGFEVGEHRPATMYDDSGGASRFFPTFRHDETGCAPGCPVAELDAQSGTLTTGRKAPGTSKARGRSGGIMGETVAGKVSAHEASSGGASRFFPSFCYQAKAPARERPKIDGKGWPTVKPLALMRWLVRLVTPPGGVVLDPFTGSGTTLQAARDEGFASIGIERDEFAYLLARQRLGFDPAPDTSEPAEGAVGDDVAEYTPSAGDVEHDEALADLLDHGDDEVAGPALVVPLPGQIDLLDLLGEAAS